MISDVELELFLNEARDIASRAVINGVFVRVDSNGVYYFELFGIIFLFKV